MKPSRSYLLFQEELLCIHDHLLGPDNSIPISNFDKDSYVQKGSNKKTEPVATVNKDLQMYQKARQVKRLKKPNSGVIPQLISQIKTNFKNSKNTIGPQYWDK